jgi:hypothetical protein
MNALRAPLTALYVSIRREVFFSLDSADAFIDSRLLAYSSDLEQNPDFQQVSARFQLRLDNARRYRQTPASLFANRRSTSA